MVKPPRLKGQRSNPNKQPKDAYRKRNKKPETTVDEWKSKVKDAHPKAGFINTTARLIKSGGYSMAVPVPALSRRIGRTMHWACLGPPVSKAIGYWSSETDWEIAAFPIWELG